MNAGTGAGRPAVRIGWVGLGAIGGRMVERLLSQGMSVSFYARRTETVDRFRDLGATPATTAAAAMEGVDVAVVCPFSDEQVEDLVVGADRVIESLRSGAVLVTHTTGSPQTAIAIADVAAERGVGVVDAPVSGTVDDVEAGRISLIVGGAAHDVEACRRVFSCYADVITHVGPVGSAQAVKLINNVVLAANVRLMTDAERLGAAFDVPPDRLAEAIRHASGGSWVATQMATAGSAAALHGAYGPYLRKDLATVSEIAEAVGVDLGLLGQVAHTGEPF